MTYGWQFIANIVLACSSKISFYIVVSCSLKYLFFDQHVLIILGKRHIRLYSLSVVEGHEIEPIKIAESKGIFWDFQQLNIVFFLFLIF